MARIYVGNSNGEPHGGDNCVPWIYFIENGREGYVDKNGQEEFLYESSKNIAKLSEAGTWKKLSPEKVAAFRPELIDNEPSKYLGLGYSTSGKVEAFDDNEKGPFALYIEDDKLYAFHFRDTSIEFLDLWKKNEWEKTISRGAWKPFTNREVEQLVAENKVEPKAPVAPAPKPDDASPYIGLREKGKTIPFCVYRDSVGYYCVVENDRLVCVRKSGRLPVDCYTIAEIKDNVASCWNYFTYAEFEKYFCNQLKTATPAVQPQSVPSMTQVIAAPVAQPNRIKPLTIKKGSLYFNTTTKQVERVITIQDVSLVWSSKHKQEVKAFPRSAFRIATTDEVKAYLSDAS
jgi:hypothetical protein